MNKLPRAELISYTNNPLTTIYCLWNKSKDEKFDMTPDEVHFKIVQNLDDMGLRDDVEETFLKVMRQQIPIAENIDFVFMIHDDPISHREQMVRHRIGVHFDDKFGVDTIPDLADSTWWSQSMRIMDMSQFASDGRFFTPETIKNDPKACAIYDECMGHIQGVYSSLVEMGIPMEDARNVMPLGTTMDISWKVNLASLIHILGKRSCWILQYGLWGYIIKTMIDELCEKVHPLFREIILPPCFTDGKFNDCVFKLENERRVNGYDELPVCSLYYQNNMVPNMREFYDEKFPVMCKKRNELAGKYEELWDRNPYTGKKKEGE